MRASDFVTEMGDTSYPYAVTAQSEDYLEVVCEELGLAVYFTVTGIEAERVLIEFAVNGMYNVTGTEGTRKAIAIFTTVHKILKTELPKIVTNHIRAIEYGAELSEPSRVKLYNRVAPIVTDMLGPNWAYHKETPKGSIQIYQWIRNESA